jgi:hypothetical protein
MNVHRQMIGAPGDRRTDRANMHLLFGHNIPAKRSFGAGVTGNIQGNGNGLLLRFPRVN